MTNQKIEITKNGWKTYHKVMKVDDISQIAGYKGLINSVLKNDFALQVIDTILKYKSVSDKQLKIVALSAAKATSAL